MVPSGSLAHSVTEAHSVTLNSLGNDSIPMVTENPSIPLETQAPIVLEPSQIPIVSETSQIPLTSQAP